LLMVPYILLSRLLGVAELAFVGRCDTRTPFVGSLVTAFSFIVISLGLFRSLHLYALPIGRSSAYLVGSLLMLHLARRQLGTLELRKLGNSTARIVVASSAMGVATFAVLRLVEMIPLKGFLRQIVALGVPSLAAGIVLLWAFVALGILDRKRVLAASRVRWLAPDL